MFIILLIAALIFEIILLYRIEFISRFRMKLLIEDWETFKRLRLSYVEMVLDFKTWNFNKYLEEIKE